MKKLLIVGLVSTRAWLHFCFRAGEPFFARRNGDEDQVANYPGDVHQQAGRYIYCRVTEPVALNGKTIIPVGSTVQGTVGRVAEPRRVQGRPTIALFPIP